MPDLCSFQLQTRIVPGQDGDATLAALEALAAEHGGDVEIVEMTEPFETPADSPLVAALDRADRRRPASAPEPIGVPAWTDAHNMVDFGGAEAVVYGPGRLHGRPHCPSEHIDVNEVVECAEVFTRLASAGGELVTPASPATSASASAAVAICSRRERRRDLDPHPRGALGDDRVAEAGDVDAAVEQPRG